MHFGICFVYGNFFSNLQEKNSQNYCIHYRLGISYYYSYYFLHFRHKWTNFYIAVRKRMETKDRVDSIITSSSLYLHCVHPLLVRSWIPWKRNVKYNTIKHTFNILSVATLFIIWIKNVLRGLLIQLILSR